MWPFVPHKSGSTFSFASRRRVSPGFPRQRGVGMIEVLISIIIASFALLGLAGLQVTSLRYQKTAQFRTLATQYAVDLADRIRANAAGAKAGNYVTAPTLYSVGAGAVAIPAVDCAANSCSVAQIANWDIINWRAGLARGMTGGWGQVSGSVGQGFIITTYYREPDKRDGLPDANCTPGALTAADTDVRCFSITFEP